MTDKFSIKHFRWEETSDVVAFLNHTSRFENTEKELSPNLFRQLHEMPGADPEKDCFVARDSERKIVAFLHMISEKPINRMVALQTVGECDYREIVATKLCQVAQEFSRHKFPSTLHVQISKQDHDWTRALNNLGWKEVKQYWNLQRVTEKNKDLEETIIPKGYKIRSLDIQKDIEEFTEIQNSAFAEHWGFCPNTSDEIFSRISMERDGQEGILLIHSEKKIAGYNWTLYSSKNGRSTGWVSMTGVHPDYRGKKLGKAIVLTGMHALIRRGAKSIELEVDSQNAPARELYFKLGFKKISETLWFETII